MPLLGRYQRWLHTVRYLRPVQIYGRLWFRLYHPRPDLRPAPPLRQPTGDFTAPPRRLPSMTGPLRFVFLNETHKLNGPGDWNNPAWEKLWLYNLHYFDDLNAQGAAAREDWHRALIQRWIAENPSGQGNGWGPYPLSLRIGNWIKWALAGHPLEASWIHSLAVQARFLRRRLEHHLLGNHLFANAKALVCAGLFFQGDEAEEWLHTGLKLLQRELPEQVLSDGGHFERSPMYHSIILEDLLDLLNLAGVYKDAFPANTPIPAWQTAAQGMRRWLKALCHPDSEISFFNDAALDIACSPPALEDYAVRLGLGTLLEPEPGITHLPNSGYVRLQQNSAVALLDVAPIGPNYLPGHAHADTLSFELSLFGQRVLVNSGTSCYGRGAERLRQRSTAAHTTVVVNGENSSEVWGGFRVADRAQPRGLTLQAVGDGLRVQCAHDGYRRLPGKPVHIRQWDLRKNGLMVYDSIHGQFNSATAYWHFHPWVNPSIHPDRRSGILHLADGREVYLELLKGLGHLQSSTYHPHFGSSEVNHCLVVTFSGSEVEILFRW